MAFVNEIADRKNPETWRTVDHERNLILKNTGSSAYNRTESFEISLDGYAIPFVTNYKKPESDEQGQSTITYEIFHIQIPDEVDNLKEEIKKYIVEALEAYGFLYRRTNIKQVNVVISPELKNF